MSWRHLKEDIHIALVAHHYLKAILIVWAYYHFLWHHSLSSVTIKKLKINISYLGYALQDTISI